MRDKGKLQHVFAMAAMLIFLLNLSRISNANAFYINSNSHHVQKSPIGPSTTRLSSQTEREISSSTRSKRKKKKIKIQKRSSQLDLHDRKKSDLTEEELAQHVSSMYVNGAGGLMQGTTKKRERMENESQQLDESQLAIIKNLDRHPALVLNADYQPLSVLPLSLWSWQETMKAVCSGKVTVVDVYPNMKVRAVNVEIALPSVIALTEYVKQPSQVPAFTRRNVFLRDGYKCQYCSKRYMTRDLSLDHYMPRCVGGKLNWKNTVTSCRKCNGKKGSTLPKNLKHIGMKIVQEPRVPTKWELATMAEKMVPKRVHQTWKPFLGMGMTPESEDNDSGETFFDSVEEY